MRLDTSRLVVIDGLPVAPEHLLPKLTAFLGKRLAPAGTIAEDGILIPADGGKSLGFAFVEFADATSAATCINSYDNQMFDKKNKMRVRVLGGGTTPYYGCVCVFETWGPHPPSMCCLLPVACCLLRVPGVQVRRF